MMNASPATPSGMADPQLPFQAPVVTFGWPTYMRLDHQVAAGIDPAVIPK